MRDGDTVKDRETKRPRKGRGMGISGKLFLYLFGFTVIVMLLIWLFQICLLDVFYERAKYKELDRVADELAFFSDDEESLKTAVYDYASRYGICVSVYKVNGSSTEEVVKSHVVGVCAVHLLTDKDRSELYEKALSNGGRLSVVYPVERQFFARNPNVDEIPDETEKTLSESEEASTEDEKPIESFAHVVVEKSENAVSVHSVENNDGQKYVFLLDSKLTPVSSIIETLELQFLWLGVILVVLALLLAVLISRAVSRPIVSMSASAHRLAQGDYGVAFVGSGFRESRELAETLNYASTELSKTDALQKELIANVSHDLRTPLTMIKGYSEIMRDLPGENTPENVQVVIDEAERMSELVSDLLDLSKIRAGSRVPTYECFDLTETVYSTLERYEKLIEHEGYVITFEKTENVQVYADRTMILQVVYNLINNAVNYTDEENKTVRVIQSLEGDNVRISVTDTGEGISKEELPLIWDRYYKVDKVHRRAMVGTGLGLSIVKQILEQHGAVYGVSSTMGKGSTFWFSLPVVSGDECKE